MSKFFIQSEKESQFTLNVSIPYSLIKENVTHCSICPISRNTMQQISKHAGSSISPPSEQASKHTTNFTTNHDQLNKLTNGISSKAMDSSSRTTDEDDIIIQFQYEFTDIKIMGLPANIPVKVSGGYFVLANGRDLLFQDRTLDVDISSKTTPKDDASGMKNDSDESAMIRISLKKLMKFFEETNFFNVYEDQVSITFQIRIQILVPLRHDNTRHHSDISQSSIMHDNGIIVDETSDEESDLFVEETSDDEDLPSMDDELGKFEDSDENTESSTRNRSDRSSTRNNVNDLCNTSYMSNISHTSTLNETFETIGTCDTEDTMRDDETEDIDDEGIARYMQNVNDTFQSNSDDDSTNYTRSKQNETTFRKRTKLFVGLENQGATCYLNSLLQTLFHLRNLRKMISEIPYKEVTNDKETDNQNSGLSPEEQLIQKNSTLALQTLFCQMTQDSTQPSFSLTTEDLTKSFGWDEEDIFEQHDVQELFSILLDKLEKELKAAGMPNHISRLFEGKEQHYIKCINVPYQSVVEQTFRDVQLPVEDCSNIYEGFDKYTEAEELVGQNQYHTEGYGMQDAKKGCIFLEFPPILVMHLKRFKFDQSTYRFVKLDDCFEFYDRIDLKKYLDDGNGVDTEYVLFSVMVQSGSMEMGHYYNYVRPFDEILENDNQGRSIDEAIDTAKWYEFNDEVVSEVDSHCAIQNNYGDKRSHTSAYMLVYIRRSQIHEVITPFSRENFPEHVKSIVKKIQATKEKRRLSIEQTKNKAIFDIYTDRYLRKKSKSTFLNGLIPQRPDENGDGSKNGRSLTDEEEMLFSPISVLLKKSSTYFELTEEIQNAIGINQSIPMRLWVFEQRRNNTLRPMTYLDPETPDTKLCRLSHFSGCKSSNKILYKRLFVEIDDMIDEDIKEYMHSHCDAEDIENGVLLFLKEFTSEGLRYLRSYFVPSSMPLGYFLFGNKYSALVEEISHSDIEERLPTSTVSEANLGNGDILILLEEGIDVKLVEDYYTSIRNSIMITLVPHNNKGEEQLISTRADLPYSIFCSQVSQLLQWPSDRIRFYGFDDIKDDYLPYPFKSNVQIVRELLQTQTDNYHLSYELLDESLVTREQKKEFNVYFHNGIKFLCQFHICCGPDEKLIDAVIKNDTTGIVRRELPNLQFLLINRNRIQCILRNSDTIQQIEDSKGLFSDFPYSYIRMEYTLRLPEETANTNYTITEITHFLEGATTLYVETPILMFVDLNWSTKTLRTKVVERFAGMTKIPNHSRIVLFKEDNSRVYMKDQDILGEYFEGTTHIGIEKTSHQPRQLRIS